jgi:GMP synthase (glutamine-hydrolysing)
MRRALAITHVPFEDPGSLSQALQERGFALQLLDACTAPAEAFGDLNPDLLVVMGGPIGAYETEVYPFLVEEIALLRRRLQARAPTLGICLGAQLMAAALGAAVYPGGNGKEIGWGPLSAGRDVAACPALAELLAPGLNVLHWHGDTFDLPAGATRLASTPSCVNQAFSLGRHVLAFQFHPEANETGFEQWLIGHACEIAAAPGVSVPDLRAQAISFGDAGAAHGQECLEAWLSGHL